MYAPSQEQHQQPDPSQVWNGQQQGWGGQPEQAKEMWSHNEESNQQQNWGVQTGEVVDGSSEAAPAGPPPSAVNPVFFNPNQFAGSVPSTRRNKYA